MSVGYECICDRATSYLNEILAFGLGDQRLKLWSREGVNQTGLRDDEQENLSASQDRELIGLWMKV